MDDVDHIAIASSLIDPQYAYPFDFLFNEHFLTHVNMQKFDYKPYIWSFLFGVFSLARCDWSIESQYPFEESRIRKIFIHKDDKEDVKFIVPVLFENRKELHFIRFYLGDNSANIDRHVSRELYANFTSSLENPDEDLSSSKPFLHVYSIYTVNDSSKAMPLMAKKILRQVASLVDDANDGFGKREQYRLIPNTECLADLSYKFLDDPSDHTPEIRQSKLDHAKKMLKSVDLNFDKRIDPQSVCGFIHGYSFRKRLYFHDEIFVHHRKDHHVEWFNLTSYNYSPTFHRKPYMLSFVSYGRKTNYSYVTDVIGYSAECGKYRGANVLSKEHHKQSGSKCMGGYSDFFHSNGLDYLTNFFRYCSARHKGPTESEQLTTYLSQIFNEILPSSVKQSRASRNYLKYFVMGTFVSTEQKLYNCFANVQYDILVFEPRDPHHPVIIITFNADYRFVSVADLSLLGPKSSLLVTLRIDEISDEDDNHLSRKSFRREIRIEWHHSLSPSPELKGKIDWIILKQSRFLTNLLNASNDYDYAAYEDAMELIGNAFPMLYADSSNSFEPFMQGIFHRKAHEKFSRSTLTTRFSRWTTRVEIESNFLFYINRRFFFSFLPTLDAAIMFLNSPKRHWGYAHYSMTIIFDPKSRCLDYIHYEYGYPYKYNHMIAEDVCKIYPDTNCKESSKKERLLSAMLPQSMSFVPPALLRHLEIIEKFTKSGKEEFASLNGSSTAGRSKRSLSKNKKSKSLPQKKQGESGERENDEQTDDKQKKDSEQESKIIGLINNTIDAMEKPSLDSIINLKTSFADLGLTVEIKNKKVKRALKPVRKIFDMYSLGQDIKALIVNSIATVKAPTIEAALELTQAYASLIDTLFTGGVKLLAHLNVISKTAWFLGPIGTTISAVSTACSIGLTLYDVGKQLATLCQTVQLTTWQVVIEGIRMASGLGLSWQVQMLTRSENEKNIVYKIIVDLIDKEWKLPKYRAYVSSYTCGGNRPCFGSIIELDRHQLVEYTDARYYSGRLSDDEHVKILCVDGNKLSVEEAQKFTMRTGINSSLSYFCHRAFVLINNNVTSPVPRALYDLGPHASVKALKGYHNHFRIIHDFVILEGGDSDDFFEFTSFLRCGYIRGGDGSDTVQLGYCGPSCEQIISRNAVGYKNVSRPDVNQCLSLDSIERIAGQPKATETIHVDCTFSMISLNGGKFHKPDKIYITDGLSCIDTILIILSGHTMVENRALGGSYLYKVTNTDQGNIKLSIFRGKFIEKSHTILIDHMAISDFAGMSYERIPDGSLILTIIDKSRFSFSLMVEETGNRVQIIFRNGEYAEFLDTSMNIIVNTDGNSLGSLMSRYGQVSFSDNISVKFGSQKLGISVELRNGSIKYNDQDSIPFKFLELQPNNGSSIVKCLPGHTYALFLNTEQNENTTFRDPTNVRFVAERQPHTYEKEISLSIDFTHILEYLNLNTLIQDYNFTIELEDIEDSELFKATAVISLSDQEMELCVLFFDGFTKYDILANIRLLATAEYGIQLKRPYSDFDEKFDANAALTRGSRNENPEFQDRGLEMIRLHKVFHYHPDYLLILTPNDVHWNESLTFPNVYLTVYDLIKDENNLVLTSIRSNLIRDISKLTKSFFTIILEDFYVSEKMQSLLMKFGDGNMIYGEELVESSVFNLTEFKSNIETVEQHLARQDVYVVDKGGIALKEWIEISFSYK